jgi:Holliday junction resolvase RusA-like endonuclease
MATIYSDPADKGREADVGMLGRAAMRSQMPFDGPIRLTVEAVFEPAASWSKSKRDAALQGLRHTAKPDADNIIKSISDGLNGVAFVDDAQVAELLVRKRYGSPARTEVVVETLTATGLL